jgi:hypothetical protein
MVVMADGGVESKPLGFCDGWELATLLGAGDSVGLLLGSEVSYTAPAPT